MTVQLSRLSLSGSPDCASDRKIQKNVCTESDLPAVREPKGRISWRSRTHPADDYFFTSYAKGYPSVFNEMFDNEEVRQPYRQVIDWVRSMPAELVAMKHSEAEKLFRRIGITFVTYGDNDDAERLIPFDMVPRILTAREWRKIESGVGY